MPPVLTSQCRRAAHHRLCLQNDSNWIPEALLAIAFERYCVISRTTIRHGSSVPGPMESRKHMGKRRMGELSLGQSHSSSPLWGIENLADLTQWQWKPPSSPDARFQQQHARNPRERGLPQAMLNWFTGFAPEPPNATAADLDLNIILEGVGEDNTVDTPEVVDQPLPKIVWDAKSTPPEVVVVGLNLLLQDLSSDLMISRPNFTTFCNTWRDYLVDGLFLGKSICSVLDGIRNGLDTQRMDNGKPLERWMADRVMLGLLEATIVGLSERRTLEHHYFDQLAWNHVLQIISGLQMNSIRIFAEAMAQIPDCYFDDIFVGVLANLRVFLTASGGECKRSTLIRQVNKMTELLKRFNPVDHLRIFEEVTRHIQFHRESKDLCYPRMRLAWLQLLARLPTVEESYLAEVCSVLESGKEVEPLSNREICEMYLAKNRSSLKDIVRLHNAIQEWDKDDSKHYGRFSMVLWQTRQFDHVKGLCQFLDKLGREQDVMRLAKGFTSLLKTEPRVLANLAIKGGNPRLAIEISSLYRKTGEDHRGFWRHDSSTEILKILAEAGYLKHANILNALSIGDPWRRRVNRSPTGLRFMKVTKAAMALAISPNVSNRTALRLISECINYIQRHRAVVPTVALQALLHNITRDLAEGKPGRTTRLRWLLYLLRKHAGGDKMVRIGLGVRRWREINARRRRRNGCR